MKGPTAASRLYSSLRIPLALAAMLFITGRILGAPDGTKEHSMVITNSQAEYTIEVNGQMDPENVEVTIENLGDRPVVNPRMTVNGLYDWYDVNSMLKEILRGNETDQDKALAIWWWVQTKRWQRDLHDETALHPVRGLNGYGYDICGHTACWVSALCRAAGLKTRVWELTGHTVSEVYFDGGWHMLDANAKTFYLGRDNQTIGSVETAEHDGGLVERTIHPTDPWFRGPDVPGRNELYKHFLVTYRDNWVSNGYDSEFSKNYNMSMTLKPGEKLVRFWQPVLAKFEGRDKNPEVPEKYANGQLIWEPDMHTINIKEYIDADPWGNITTRGEDGRDPAIHIAALQDGANYNSPSRFGINIHSPYPIVGGHLGCMLVKEGSSEMDQAKVLFGWDSSLYDLPSDKVRKTVELDLDPSILKQGVIYDYSISFAFRGNAKSTPPTQAGLDSLRSITDLQVAPDSLPALSLGKNVIHYWNEPGGPERVRITYKWREVNDRRPAEQVTAILSPGNGAEVASLAPTLKWSAPGDSGSTNRSVDYQVMVCSKPDCRWPLSPSLFRNVGYERGEWNVPATFLNAATTYYWKVRARNSTGGIGAWSPVFSFTTSKDAK